MASSSLLTPTSQAHIPVAALSHKGLVRANNEDRLLVNSFFLNADGNQPVLLAALADGVGGHQGGEVAAQTGIETIYAHVANIQSLDDPVVLLRNAVLAANQAVQARAQSEKAVSGMGATCVCALLVGLRLYIASLGDSRAYLADEHGITQITQDHTWMEENGGVDLAGMRGLGRRHPFAHVLSRYLGCSQSLEVDLRLRMHAGESDADKLANQGTHLHPGQQVLLCSDGLSDMLSNEDIHSILRAYPPRKAVQKLVLCTLEAGGHDNVSVILLQMN